MEGKSKIVIISILFISACSNNQNSKVSLTDTVFQKTDSIKREQVINDFNNVNRLYVFGDSVSIHKNPYDTSEIILNASWLKPFQCYKYYFDYSNNHSNSLSQALWVCVKTMEKDSSWIKLSDITYKIDIDSSAEYRVIHQYSKGGYGSVCYISSAIVKEKMILYLQGITDRNGKWINNKYYLFPSHSVATFTGNPGPFSYIYLFDKETEKVKLLSNGLSPVTSANNQDIVFLKDHENSKELINCELCKYNINTQAIKVLYKEKNDSVRSCLFYEDGANCSNIKISKENNIENYSFNLYLPINEQMIFSPYKQISLKVDELGNILYRKEEIIK